MGELSSKMGSHTMPSLTACILAYVGGNPICILPEPPKNCESSGDRGYFFDYLLANKLRFMIRVRGDRGLRTAQGLESAVDLARSCPMLFNETVVKEEAGHERSVSLECGLRKVRLPDRREEPTLVVVKGFGDEPLMILTNAYFAAVYLGLRMKLRVLAGHALRAAKRLYAPADGIRQFLDSQTQGLRKFLERQTPVAGPTCTLRSIIF